MIIIIQTQQTRKVAAQGSQPSIHRANCNLVSAKYYTDAFHFECLVFCTLCFRELSSVGENLHPTTHTHSPRESWSPWRPACLPASSGGDRVLVHLRVQWLPVPPWTAQCWSVRPDLLPSVPRHRHTGWTVTGSMTFCWNVPITGLMEDKGKTQPKGRLAAVREGGGTKD